MYNMITSGQANNCSESDSADNVPDFCMQGIIGSLIISNKRNDVDSVTTQLVLNFASVIVITLVFHIIRYKVRKTVVDVDKETITPADFTVIVKGVSPSISDGQIKSWLQGFSTEKLPLEIRKVIRTYNIKDYINYINKRNELLKKIDDEAGQKEFEKMKLLHAQIQALQLNLGETKAVQLSPTPIVFVTFKKANHAEYIANRFERGFWRRLCEKSNVSVDKESQHIGKGRIKIKRAPEPSDILWDSLSYKTSEKFKTRLFTRLATFIAIMIGFGLIILIYWAQNIVIGDNEENIGIVELLSIAASLAIIVVNTLLGVVIRIFTQNEKYSTFTRYSTELAEKLSFAQLINTAFTPLLAKLILTEDLYSGKSFTDVIRAMNFYGKGGLLENMFFVFIINAALPPLLSVFDPILQIKKIKRKRLLNKKNQNIKLTQKEAHELFEETFFNVPNQYVLVIKTMLLTSFYAPAMPIVIVFSIIGLILLYWENKSSNKYALLRRSTLPNSMDHHLTHHMIETLEWMAFVFAMGNLLFVYTLENSDGEPIFDLIPRYLIWATIGVSLFHIYFPMEWINKVLFKVKGEEKGEDIYDEARPSFHTDYDIENPVTRKDAIKELLRNIKATKEVPAPRKRRQSKQQNGFLENLKVECFLKLINIEPSREDSEKLNEKLEFDLDLLEDYANEKIQRQATIFKQRPATAYEMKDLKLFCDEVEGFKSVEQGAAVISNILLKAGRTHKWKKYQFQTSYFTFQTKGFPKGHKGSNQEHYEINIDFSQPETEEDNASKKRKRSRTEFAPEIDHPYKPAPLRLNELSIYYRDTKRPLKDSANVTRTDLGDVDYSASTYPINILDPPQFLFKTETAEDLSFSQK